MKKNTAVKTAFGIAAAGALAFSGIATAHATEAESITVAWQLPEGFVHDPDVNPESLPWGEKVSTMFPQTLAPAVPECETWLQMDTYRYGDATGGKLPHLTDRERVDGLLAAGFLDMNNLLSGEPDDAGLHVASSFGPGGWWFEWTGECVEEEVPVEEEAPETETPVTEAPKPEAETPKSETETVVTPPNVTVPPTLKASAATPPVAIETAAAGTN